MTIRCVQFSSTQHDAEPLKAVPSKETAGYSGLDETAPSKGDMNKLIKVIKRSGCQILKS